MDKNMGSAQELIQRLNQSGKKLSKSHRRIAECIVTHYDKAAFMTASKLGKLVDVMQPGGNDVYVFNGPLGEVLVPALKSVVHEVCVEEKRIVFDAVRLNEVAVFNED